MANPSNFRPIFTQEQLTASLCATSLATLIIRNAIIMDVGKLHNDIHSSLPLNPISAAHLPTPTAPNWALDESGLLRQYDRIYVPDANDLRLKLLQYKHDHILSGHGLGMTRICMAQPPNPCANILQILHNLHAFEVTPPQTLQTIEATSDPGKTVELHFH